MTRAHKIILASALVLGLGGSFAQAAPMNEYFPSFPVASTSDVEVVLIDGHNRMNKDYKYMLNQPEIYAAEAKSILGKNKALASKLRSMNVQLNNVAGIVQANDGSFTVVLR